jgi:hypothetical protein
MSLPHLKIDLKAIAIERLEVILDMVKSDKIKPYLIFGGEVNHNGELQRFELQYFENKA